MPRDEKIYPGQRVRVRVKTVDPETREPLNVGDLTLIFSDPEGVEVAVPMANPILGKYVGSYVVNASGPWHYRIEGVEPGIETGFESDFKVERTNF